MPLISSGEPKDEEAEGITSARNWSETARSKCFGSIVFSTKQTKVAFFSLQIDKVFDYFCPNLLSENIIAQCSQKLLQQRSCIPLK